VSDILESLCGILPTDIKHDFLTTAVKQASAQTFSAIVVNRAGLAVKCSTRKSSDARLSALHWRIDVRVFVDKLAAVVDLVVDNHVDVVLAGVLRDIRVGEFFLSHIWSFSWYA